MELRDFFAVFAELFAENFQKIVGNFRISNKNFLSELR